MGKINKHDIPQKALVPERVDYDTKTTTQDLEKAKNLEVQLAAYKLYKNIAYTATPHNGDTKKCVYFHIKDEGNDNLIVSVFEDSRFTKVTTTLPVSALLSYVENFTFSPTDLMFSSEPLAIAQEKEDILDNAYIKKYRTLLDAHGIIPEAAHVAIPKAGSQHGILHFSLEIQKDGLFVSCFSDDTGNTTHHLGNYPLKNFLQHFSQNFSFKALPGNEPKDVALAKILETHDIAQYNKRHTVIPGQAYTAQSDTAKKTAYIKQTKTSESCFMHYYTDNSFTQRIATQSMSDFMRHYPEATITPVVPKNKPEQSRKQLAPEHVHSKRVGADQKPTEASTESESYFDALPERFRGEQGITRHIKIQQRENTEKPPQPKDPNPYVTSLVREKESLRQRLLQATTTTNIIQNIEQSFNITLKPNGSLSNPWNIFQRIAFRTQRSRGERSLFLFAQKRLAIITKESEQKKHVPHITTARSIPQKSARKPWLKRLFSR